MCGNSEFVATLKLAQKLESTAKCRRQITRAAWTPRKSNRYYIAKQHYSKRRVVGLFFLKTNGTGLAWMEVMSSGITMSPEHGMAAGLGNMPREVLSLIKPSHLLHIFIDFLCCFPLRNHPRIEARTFPLSAANPHFFYWFIFKKLWHLSERLWIQLHHIILVEGSWALVPARPFTICAIIHTHKILFWPVLIQLYSNVRLLLAAFISPVLNLLPTSFYRNKDDWKRRWFSWWQCGTRG